jgi:hypothetical protein
LALVLNLGAREGDTFEACAEESHVRIIASPSTPADAVQLSKSPSTAHSPGVHVQGWPSLVHVVSSMFPPRFVPHTRRRIGSSECG